MIKTRCWECASKEDVEKINNFNENFSDYLNRAVAGENPYKLEIDKKWAKFIFQSSKMTLIKAIVLLIGIAPSFSNIFRMLSTRLIIKGCYVGDDPNATLPLGECLKYNRDLAYVKFDWSLTSMDFAEIAILLLLFLYFSIPQIVFLGFVWFRFHVNKLTLFLSAAKIHLSTFGKRHLTFTFYLLLIGMLVLIYSSCKDVAGWNDHFGEGYQVAYNDKANLTLVFERSDSSSTSFLISSGLIYSCLITVLFAQTRQPLAFFIGLRQYLKEASRVPYNIANIDYRIESEPLNWKFIQRYYQECERYDPRIVLIAMTTHFRDTQLLEVESENNKASSVALNVNE